MVCRGNRNTQVPKASISTTQLTSITNGEDSENVLSAPARILPTSSYD